jgi:phosphatidate cytidylyltransferase
MIFKQLTPLQQRLTVSTLGTLLALLMIYLSPVPAFKPIFAVFIAAIIGIALWELMQIAYAKRLNPSITLCIVLSTLYTFSVVIAAQFHFAKMLPSLVLLAALLSGFFYYFAKGTSPFINLSITIFSIAYLTIPLSCMISIVYFFPPDSHEDGRWWLLYVVFVTKMTDIGAFFIGKKFGRQKLAPYISPKKTWEGAFGGLVAAIFASVILILCSALFDGKAFGLSLWQGIWLGALLGILAQCGDLAESLLKRDGGIKDSSQLPGLGGMLDIVDSLVFTAPLMYILLKIYGE